MQVLATLLDHAIKHTPAGGVITVRTRAALEGLEIEVEDSGEGIAPEHLPHIFERAFRANPARTYGPNGSYGFGLAIVKYLTEAHRGTVRVRSELGSGSCFTLWFPRGLEWRADDAGATAPLQQPAVGLEALPAT